MLKERLVPTENISPENSCGGCGNSIRDRFYLLAADRAWHGQCLRCCQCTQPLDTELSCFSRDGNIYCKEDYYRLFSSRRCARCGAGLSSSELVMRARELVFHVTCFSCILCGTPLSAGDTAGLRGGRIFCGKHFDADTLSESSNTLPGGGHFFTGSPQKGRPRKRKTPQNHHHLLHHHNNHQLQMETAEGAMGRTTPMGMELLQSDLQNTSLDLSSYDGSQSPGSGGSLTPQSRTKRMRTSFKHHQLRTMKSYFAINQNPDAKDLKQLAQKTGLSKRVLQVWFQNARAKWRRNVMRQEGQLTCPTSMVGTSNLVSLQQSLASMATGGPPSVHSSNSNLESTTGAMTPSHSIDEMHHMTFSELY